MGMFDNAVDEHERGLHIDGDTSGVCPRCKSKERHAGCRYWLDLPWLATEGDDSDEVKWVDWPTASCRLPYGHSGKHEMVLDKDTEQ